MSLGQNEPAFLYTCAYTRLFIREACYGGRRGAKFQEFQSSVSTAISTVIRSPTNWNAEDIWNLMVEYINSIEL